MFFDFLHMPDNIKRKDRLDRNKDGDISNKEFDKALERLLVVEDQAYLLQKYMLELETKQSLQIQVEALLTSHLDNILDGRSPSIETHESVSVMYQRMLLKMNYIVPSSEFFALCTFLKKEWLDITQSSIETILMLLHWTEFDGEILPWFEHIIETVNTYMKHPWFSFDEIKGLMEILSLDAPLMFEFVKEDLSIQEVKTYASIMQVPLPLSSLTQVQEIQTTKEHSKQMSEDVVLSFMWSWPTITNASISSIFHPLPSPLGIFSLGERDAYGIDFISTLAKHIDVQASPFELWYAVYEWIRYFDAKKFFDLLHDQSCMQDLTTYITSISRNDKIIHALFLQIVASDQEEDFSEFLSTFLWTSDLPTTKSWLIALWKKIAKENNKKKPANKSEKITNSSNFDSYQAGTWVGSESWIEELWLGGYLYSIEWLVPENVIFKVAQYSRIDKNMNAELEESLFEEVLLPVTKESEEGNWITLTWEIWWWDLIIPTLAWYQLSSVDIQWVQSWSDMSFSVLQNDDGLYKISRWWDLALLSYTLIPLSGDKQPILLSKEERASYLHRSTDIDFLDFFDVKWMWITWSATTRIGKVVDKLKNIAKNKLWYTTDNPEVTQAIWWFWWIIDSFDGLDGLKRRYEWRIPGDCDVFSCIWIEFLRSYGIPARMVAWFSPTYTKEWVYITTEWHAIIEYYDSDTKEWIPLDLTLFSPETREYAARKNKKKKWWRRPTAWDTDTTSSSDTEEEASWDMDKMAKEKISSAEKIRRWNYFEWKIINKVIWETQDAIDNLDTTDENYERNLESLHKDLAKHYLEKVRILSYNKKSIWTDIAYLRSFLDSVDLCMSYGEWFVWLRLRQNLYTHIQRYLVDLSPWFSIQQRLELYIKCAELSWTDPQEFINLFCVEQLDYLQTVLKDNTYPKNTRTLTLLLSKIVFLQKRDSIPDEVSETLASMYDKNLKHLLLLFQDIWNYTWAIEALIILEEEDLSILGSYFPETEEALSERVVYLTKDDFPPLDYYINVPELVELANDSYNGFDLYIEWFEYTKLPVDGIVYYRMKNRETGQEILFNEETHKIDYDKSTFTLPVWQKRSDDHFLYAFLWVSDENYEFLKLVFEPLSIKDWRMIVNLSSMKQRHADVLKSLNVAKITKIKFEWIQIESDVDIDFFSRFTEVTDIDVSTDWPCFFPIWTFQKVKKIQIRSYISNIDELSLPNLTHISCFEKDMTDDFLEHLIPLLKNNSVQSLDVSWLHITEDNKEKISSVFDRFDNKLTSFSFSWRISTDISDIYDRDTITSLSLSDVTFDDWVTFPECQHLENISCVETSALSVYENNKIKTIRWDVWWDFSFYNRTNLESCSIFSHEKISLEWIETCSSLKEITLNLNHLEDVWELSLLWACPHLEKIHLQWSSKKLTSLDFLSGLSNLVSLEFSWEYVTSYAWIQGLVWLKDVTIQSYAQEELDDNLLWLSTLEHVTFYHPTFRNIDWIWSLSSLKTIYISGPDNFTWLSGEIANLSWLEELTIQNCESSVMTIPKEFGSMRSLKKLVLTWSMWTLENIENIYAHSSLEDLYLAPEPPITIDEWIVHMSQLRKATLWKCILSESIRIQLSDKEIPCYVKSDYLEEKSSVSNTTEVDFLKKKNYKDERVRIWAALDVLDVFLTDVYEEHSIWKTVYIHEQLLYYIFSHEIDIWDENQLKDAIRWYVVLLWTETASPSSIFSYTNNTKQIDWSQYLYETHINEDDVHVSENIDFEWYRSPDGEKILVHNSLKKLETLLCDPHNETIRVYIDSDISSFDTFFWDVPFSLNRLKETYWEKFQVYVDWIPCYSLSTLENTMTYVQHMEGKENAVQLFWKTRTLIDGQLKWVREKFVTNPNLWKLFDKTSDNGDIVLKNFSLKLTKEGEATKDITSYWVDVDYLIKILTDIALWEISWEIVLPWGGKRKRTIQLRPKESHDLLTILEMWSNYVVWDMNGDWKATMSEYDQYMFLNMK